MGNKIPPSMGTLVKRLRRVAKYLDAGVADTPQQKAANAARANTCWQAAGRIEELHERMSGSAMDKLFKSGKAL